ncbi:hypothetical protein DNK77_24185 [Enterobacter cloacae complex sp.]|nr:hypothetical protein DNK77_24185 [Enterobacter cloacae complex sp.]
MSNYPLPFPFLLCGYQYFSGLDIFRVIVVPVAFAILCWPATAEFRFFHQAQYHPIGGIAAGSQFPDGFFRNTKVKSHPVIAHSTVQVQYRAQYVSKGLLRPPDPLKPEAIFSGC